jgi:hypothetical protein
MAYYSWAENSLAVEEVVAVKAVLRRHRRAILQYYYKWAYLQNKFEIKFKIIWISFSIIIN